MARRERLEFVGGTYHAFARGNRRERVFRGDDDYQAFVADLRDLARQHGAAVLAYCLMPNHWHLCLRTDSDPLSVVMHRLNTRHAMRFNRRYRVPGHLNQGRYGALIVNEDLQLLGLVRYIHRNPVCGGLASTCEEWPHSSHRAYLAGGEGWLVTDAIVQRLGGIAGYRLFVDAADDAEMLRAVFTAKPEALLRDGLDLNTLERRMTWLGYRLAPGVPSLPSRRAANTSRTVPVFTFTCVARSRT